MSSIEAPHHINIPFKERDESLVALPKNYFGPGVFRSKALYLPVYVRGILEENSGNHRASIAINLGDRQIGLEGNVAVERLAAMPSDVAKFLNGTIVEQPPNADYSDAAEQKDSDDHLRFVPEGYQGPAVFKTDTIGLPVIVEQHLGEQDGVRLVKLLLDLPEENLRLHGKYWIGRIKAGASDIAIFENQNGRGPKE